MTTAGSSAAMRRICRRIRASSPASIPPLIVSAIVVSGRLGVICSELSGQRILG
jgi:hypothetical protein